ncbi:uncharacterized protein LOC110185776 [Drosophila serrata]|uniref:uncharacterized protein LOC110185776 n=1 Tax=Drosophila serrata TaxID=7274 RepID=UPI000A1D1940|nr:uncharacterized protein LOC110185776 [Drosophila serrata]
MQLFMAGLLLVLVLDYSASIWIKKYMENYHRPTYYNKRHRAKDHVDYNREALERLHNVKPKISHRPPFDPDRDISYYVHVLHHASVICSGALISYRMVITSSHCFRDDMKMTVYRASDLGVVTGGEFAMSDPHAVIAFFMPVNGIKKNITSVALLGLESKLDREYYRYIKIYHKVPKLGDRVKIGFLDPQEYLVKHMDTVILNYERCQSYHALRRLFRLPSEGSDYICVRNKRNSLRSTCSTRPGDPLLVGNQLAAINMFGEHCSTAIETVNMDIYLPMRPVIKFIQLATDSLRAFTHTGPYNTSIPRPPSPLE